MNIQHLQQVMTLSKLRYQKHPAIFSYHQERYYTYGMKEFNIVLTLIINRMNGLTEH